MSVSNSSPIVTGLSIVIPAYDELLNLRELVPELKQVTQQLQNFSTEILIVLPSIAKPEEIQEIKNFGATVIMRQPTDSWGRIRSNAIPKTKIRVGSHQIQHRKVWVWLSGKSIRIGATCVAVRSA